MKKFLREKESEKVEGGEGLELGHNRVEQTKTVYTSGLTKNSLSVKEIVSSLPTDQFQTLDLRMI